MEGNDRRRYCGACKLHVLNVAGMTRQEVADAVGGREGRLCMRLLRRADGTVITKDCPVGARDVRRRIVKSLAVCGAMFASVFGLEWYGTRKEDMGEVGAVMGKVADHSTSRSQPKPGTD